MRIVSMQARNTVFDQHQVDGIVSVVVGSPMDMIVAAKEGRGDPIYIMPFSDFGIRTMASGAVVHDDTIATRPELVRCFTRASLKAMNELDNEAMAGPVLAFDGVDLSAAQGEFVAVVGPSGCGKSTLLKLVAGLMAGRQRAGGHGAPERAAHAVAVCAGQHLAASEVRGRRKVDYLEPAPMFAGKPAASSDALEREPLPRRIPRDNHLAL